MALQVVIIIKIVENDLMKRIKHEEKLQKQLQINYSSFCFASSSINHIYNVMAGIKG